MCIYTLKKKISVLISSTRLGGAGELLRPRPPMGPARRCSPAPAFPPKHPKSRLASCSQHRAGSPMTPTSPLFGIFHQFPDFFLFLRQRIAGLTRGHSTQRWNGRGRPERRLAPVSSPSEGVVTTNYRDRIAAPRQILLFNCRGGAGRDAWGGPGSASAGVSVTAAGHLNGGKKPPVCRRNQKVETDLAFPNRRQHLSPTPERPKPALRFTRRRRAAAAASPGVSISREM